MLLRPSEEEDEDVLVMTGWRAPVGAGTAFCEMK
jgi:hypothetical protein